LGKKQDFGEKTRFFGEKMFCSEILGKIYSGKYFFAGFY
jgi:hypothetical protein